MAGKKGQKQPRLHCHVLGRATNSGETKQGAIAGLLVADSGGGDGGGADRSEGGMVDGRKTSRATLVPGRELGQQGA